MALRGQGARRAEAAGESLSEPRTAAPGHQAGFAGSLPPPEDGLERRTLLAALRALRKGDFTARLPAHFVGIDGELAQAFNDIVETSELCIVEAARLHDDVSTRGRLAPRGGAPAAPGAWGAGLQSVNALVGELAAFNAEMSQVIEAVGRGDLSRAMPVELHGRPLRGDLLRQAESLNAMVARLRDQEWQKSNLARLIRVLQLEGDLAGAARRVLSELAPLVNAQQGVLYSRVRDSAQPRLHLLASYAHGASASFPESLAFGEGLVGQCACERKRILLEDVPHDYARIGSAIGSVAARNVIMLPVLFEGEVEAVMELASLRPFSAAQLAFLDQLVESLGIVFSTIDASMRTRVLLEQSRALTRELQGQQEELLGTNERLERQSESLRHSEALLRAQQEDLRRSNDELQERARQLSAKMQQVELRNHEVEQARETLQERTEQLALSSRYKSEFLANMSHELRTPLNSLLILARMLAGNGQGNLSADQVEYAQAIHASGTELLAIINDVLDLAKIESGTVTLELAPERFGDLQGYLERSFRQLALDKGLAFEVSVAPALPAAMETDGKRLHQVLRNLLSNAFKFTDRGSVALRIAPAGEAGRALFAVSDTGIGIPAAEQKVIFEPFRQAGRAHGRNYGGTGLGLSISRELTRLLGGEMQVSSSPGKGSTFTVTLPLAWRARKADPADAPALPEPEAAPAGAAYAWKTETSRSKAPRPAQPAPAGGAAVDADVAAALAGRTVLIIDDDIRNIFALTASLEQYGVTVLNAETGREGVEMLQATPGIDAVLMDIMMPEMDGYETTRVIRSMERFARLPVIAVTARAMKGDREKCLAAGATDYVAKPVSVEQLARLLKELLAAMAA